MPLGIVIRIGLCCSLVLALAAAAVAAPAMSEEELERWFNDDSDEAESRALDVNEGKLVFLPQLPTKAVHQIHNTLVIDDNSLRSGWVKINQCHHHLDAVAASEIVYRYHRLRRLIIVSSHGIERAWIEGNSVQLSNIQHNASLCVSAEAGILYQNPDHSFSLRNGPFHRKFLDGYYPMQVILDLHYPSDRLRLQHISPTPQPGFRVSPSPNRLWIDAWFEGELRTELRFVPIPSHDGDH